MSELPKGWVACTPSDLANDPKNEIVDGPFGSNLKASEYTDEGTPIVRIQNVKRMAFLDKNIKYVTDEKAEFLKRHSFKSGDLLITKLGEPLGLTCIAPEHLNEGIIVADIVRFRPNPEVNRKCLAYFLNSEKAIKQINEHTKGSTRARINLSVVRNLDISLPPLAEQKRIVEKLDEVLAQVDTIKARLDGIPVLLKRFRQSVLTSAVSGKLTEEWRGEVESVDSPYCVDWKWPKVPLSWEVKQYPELVDSRLGKMLDKAKNQGVSTKYLGNINVRWFEFDLKSVQEILISEKEQQELQLVKGDVLICEGGEPGRCAVWRSNSGEQIIFQKALHRARVKDEIIPEWLALNLKNDADALTLNQLFTGTTIKHLTGKALKCYPIRVPPLEEQKEIVRLVEQYFVFADTIEAQVKKAQAKVDNLTQSILAKAFRGELVLQDPNDESADKLLERIAKAREEAEALAKAAKKVQAAKKRAAKATK
ncbi:restriction endonuclease subunit S [Vibrio crassostreae]|uniref:restriction endonuclease subunit S n=1 Tax=Vibrio crassostreae TaxID=246167 RepID=UPI001B30D6C1|nr:restriction endonuclease subunit S [Vibrio crassostreae]